ncbi:MAG: Gfo/Idh/MocA family oxidoreductase [Chloroflexota bacterium]
MDQNDKKVGWGILGNATIARVCVVPAIAKSRNGYVAAIGSRSPERARALTDQHGGKPLVGYEAVIQDPHVDAVYIPLPNHLHKAWAIAALNAGKDVLVEKPFAMNAAEAATMVDTAAKNGRYIMEAFMYRFHPRTQKIKKMVDQGDLGKIGTIRTAFTFPVERDGSNERLFLPEMGGGSLWDVGSYGVSVARFMLGQEPESIAAAAEIGESGVDINFVGVLKFAGGALAVVESGFLSHLQQTYAIMGDKGAIELPHDAFVPWEKDAVFTFRQNNAEEGERIMTAGADEYQLMVEYFADVVLGDIERPIEPTDSVRQMEVMDQLKERIKAEA